MAFNFFPKNNRVRVLNNIPRSYSFADTLKQYRIFESLFGVCRYYPPQRTAEIIQKLYGAIVIAVLLTQYFTGYHVTIFDPLSEYLPFKILDSLWLAECIGYIIIATFWCRLKYVSLLDKMSIIDERLNLKDDKRFNDIVSLQNLTGILNTFFIYFMLATMRHYISMHNLNDFSIHQICEFIRNMEFLHICLIMRAINSRLYYFNRIITIDNEENEMSVTSKRIRLWNEFCDENKHLDSLGCGQIAMKDLLETYKEIIECSKILNDLINKVFFGFIITGSAEILIASYLLMTDYFSKELVELKYSPLTFPFWALSSYRLFSYPIQLCYLANKSKLIHKVTLLTLHDRICKSDTDVLGRKLLKRSAAVVSRHRLEYTLGGVVLDMSFPLKLFSVIATYIIVLIQFKKLGEQ